ncbi:hypothetical protein SAMN05216227_1001118 [Pseudorhodobacter antarcticus]|jgi:carbon monoxide dehydrogenase subunit G|uniref:Polyketide cyclase / dehydrase and lipid transport n=1 Tax=Pseudorhodobacter antarcticus TaxID=1077947 RepID=A0A1H8AHT0_9RHOB|nr:hypothetical protein [Pseudorhodobacter antarcticus]SEM69524.1 hypothetical protein SAMN05216227_1001118 [Pseudorhodobacter antarcticus]
MKLTAKEDIEAPIAFVNAVLTDFETWERAAMRRGADVERTDRMPALGVGMEWKVAFTFRGKTRKLNIKLASMLAEQSLGFDVMSKPAEAVFGIEMAEMGPRRTRIVLTMELKPRTLAARLFLQSLKLAKAKVNRRFTLRLSQLCAGVEDRYRNREKV